MMERFAKRVCGAAGVTILGLISLPSGWASASVGDPARGRQLFEGRAHCSLCHGIGSDEEGRGPDLEGIGGRAEERAKQYGIEGPDAGSRYLAQSILMPAKDVVEGFNAMPESWLPSGLADEDLIDLVSYLRSLGGEDAGADLTLRHDWLEAKRAEYQREVRLFDFGDPAAGRKLFEDTSGNAGCIRCHSIDGEGEDICPDLTDVHFVQRPSYVLQSVLDSSAFIVHGYRQLMIWDDQGAIHVGLPTDEDDEVLTLVIDDQGTTEDVWKDEIEEQQFSDVSRMPGNFASILSAKDVLDVVSYVLQHDTLAPSKVSGGKDADAGKDSGAPVLDVFPELTEDESKYEQAFRRGDWVQGSRIYKHNCVMCHGEAGTGTGFNAVNLETKPADHTDDRRMSKTEDRLLHGVITQGGLKTGRSVLMPPWGGTLSGRQIWDLVAYLRTLHADVPHASR